VIPLARNSFVPICCIPADRKRDKKCRAERFFYSCVILAVASETALVPAPADRAVMHRAAMIARTLPSLRRALDALRVKKPTIAPVPTMGALHDGHVSLLRQAQRRATRVIVSIFVNPAQFAPHEDFDSYPRTWKADVAELATEKVDLIRNPDVKTM
jgi:cytidyltransferase-like protein